MGIFYKHGLTLIPAWISNQLSRVDFRALVPYDICSPLHSSHNEGDQTHTDFAEIWHMSFFWYAS